MGSAHRAGWFRGEFYMPPAAAGKPYNRPAGVGKQANLAPLEEMHSPFGGWRHHLARWEACHWIRGSRGSPMNPVPLPPPQFGGAAKGKCLNGQARRLTSPHLEVLCRMCTVDNKAPQSNPFTQRIAKNKVPPPGGRWWRQPPKGVHFRRPQGGCMVLYKPAPSII